jgi:uncharacterized membrane protein
MKNCIKEYLDNCKTLLPMYGKNEKLFIQRMNDSLLEFEEEKSDLNYDNIVKRFGTPSSVVNAYIENLDTDTLIKNIKRTKIIKKIAISIIVIISLVSLSVAGYELYKYNQLCKQIQEHQPVQVETTIE